MKIFLLNQLIDNCCWSTLEVFKDEQKAKERLKQLKKENMHSNGWMCKNVYEIKDMDLK